jgi:tRNA(fMet)-specific endonuclease VapC
MKYLLDTNVCVDYLTGRYPSVASHIMDSSPNEICSSSIVVAELRYGADKSSRRTRNHQLLDRLFSEITVSDFDVDAASTYGKLRAYLEKKGTLIGPNDMLIAAHALSLGLVFVTDNVREFRRVKGLKVENWRE